MSFSLTAKTADTTISLVDHNPFGLESALGLTGSQIVRHEQRGALHTDTSDLGYRVLPREMVLTLNFHADTDAALDAHRKTLYSVFRPVDTDNIALTVTRDDGEVRVLFCQLMESIRIDLSPEDKAAHMHRAIIKLRAARPLWRPTVATESSMDWTALTEWWLAGGALTSGQVKDSSEYPNQGQQWGHIGSAHTGDWGVAFVTREDTDNDSDDHYLFNMLVGSGGSARMFNVGTTGPPKKYQVGEFTNSGQFYDWQGESTAYNFHSVYRSGNMIWATYDADGVVDSTTFGVGSDLGSVGFWRNISGVIGAGANTWVYPFRKAIVWSLSAESEVAALVPYMLNTLTGTINYVNDGDVNAYPILTLYGPMADPVIVNETTNGTIDLTGVTLGSTDTIVIDLQTGDKSVFDQAVVNQLGSATNPISLARFYLAPAPTAAGGTNTIVVYPGSAGSAAHMTMETYNEYLSY